MEINEFYKGILESVGLIIDGKHVYLQSSLAKTPLQIDGRNLVLPLRQVLDDPSWDSEIAFHPLSENIARKDSVVLQRLQSLTNLFANVLTGELLKTMVDYCVDTDSHATLNHKQNAFLECFPDADNNTVTRLDNIIDALGNNHQFVKLVTLRDKKIGEKKEFFSRVCFVKFPFYDECLTMLEGKRKEYHLFGVKVRKKDVIGFKRLFEFIFKHLDQIDAHYTAGSRSSIAPSFHALMLAYNNVLRPLRDVYRLLKLEFPDLRWTEELQDLNKFKGLIPPLDGNEGELTEGERRRKQTEVPPPEPVAKKKGKAANTVNSFSQNELTQQPQPPYTEKVGNFVEVNTANRPHPVANVVPPTTPVQEVPVQTSSAVVNHTRPTNVESFSFNDMQRGVSNQVNTPPMSMYPPQMNMGYPQPMMPQMAPQPVNYDQYGRPLDQWGRPARNHPPMYQTNPTRVYNNGFNGYPQPMMPQVPPYGYYR